MYDYNSTLYQEKVTIDQYADRQEQQLLGLQAVKQLGWYAREAGQGAGCGSWPSTGRYAHSQLVQLGPGQGIQLLGLNSVAKNISYENTSLTLKRRKNRCWRILASFKS